MIYAALCASFYVKWEDLSLAADDVHSECFNYTSVIVYVKGHTLCEGIKRYS